MTLFSYREDYNLFFGKILEGLLTKEFPIEWFTSTTHILIVFL